MSYFKKASKSLAKAKIALTGPSGSGKTLSALYIAKGLGGKTGVIDTENNSSSLYEDRFKGWEYFVLPINPPYTAQKYLKAIEIAEQEGIEILIIDSLSHVWAAEGGLLQQKEALDSRGGNSFSNWASISKLYEQLKSKLLHSNLHMICTMRSKQEYILEQNDKGKQAPKKVGLAPVMRDGMEYEFTVVFDIGMDHQFMVSKDRTGLFDGVVAHITEGTGKELRAWLSGDNEPEGPDNNDKESYKKEDFEDIPDFPEETPAKAQEMSTPKSPEPPSAKVNQVSEKVAEPDNGAQATQLPKVDKQTPPPPISGGLMTIPMYERLQRPDETLEDCIKRVSGKDPKVEPVKQAFIFPSGKFKGKSLDQVDPKELVSYMRYLKDRAPDGLKGWAKEFEEAFNAL